MTKRKTAGLTFAVILSLALILAGCGSGSSGSTEDVSEEETETAEETEGTAASALPEYDPADYVILDSYIGVEVEMEDRAVTDDEYETALNNLLSGYSTVEEITDRNTEEGDTINFDYSGSIDGEIFDGGTASGQTAILGNGGWIDGFEEGLIDRPCGEEFVIEATFPDNYSSNEDLSGKTAEFTVTIHYIEGDEIIPELTDDFVQTLEDYDCSTAAEFEEEYMAVLTEQKSAYVDYLGMVDVWDILLDRAEFTGYPEGYLEAYEDDMIAYYEMYASYYGCELEEFIEMLGTDMETFYGEVEEYAKSQMENELLYRYIAQQEGIEVTEDEYLEIVQYYADYYGYSDMASFVNAYGEDAVEAECYAQALYEKVVEFCFDGAVQVPMSTEETQSADEEDVETDAADTETTADE